MMGMTIMTVLSPVHHILRESGDVVFTLGLLSLLTEFIRPAETSCVIAT